MDTAAATRDPLDCPSTPAALCAKKCALPEIAGSVGMDGDVGGRWKSRGEGMT